MSVNPPLNLMQYKPDAPFQQRHLLTLQGWSEADILQTLSLALQLKEARRTGLAHPLLQGKFLAMIFTKASTRTRVSFEVGIQQLGGHALFLSGNDLQIGRGEPIADTARVLSRMVDGIMIRTFAQADVADLAQYGSVPVINGLTDAFHPCQILADLLTLYERKGGFAGRKLAYIGDGNNVSHSLMIGCSKLGIDIALACPDGYGPNPEYLAWARRNAEARGGRVLITADPAEAAEAADAVYTDVWASMGQEAERAARLRAFAGYQVDEALMARAQPDAIFLHCLPAHRGEEVSAAVIDGPQSAVFDQAENRLHAQKAVMALLMK
jgi:ornithine carbamoyltransferase